MPACPTQPRGKAAAAPTKGDSLPCQAWELRLSHVCALCPAPSSPQGCDQSSLQSQIGWWWLFSGFLLGVEAKKEELSLPVLPLPS